MLNEVLYYEDLLTGKIIIIISIKARESAAEEEYIHVAVY